MMKTLAKFYCRMRFGRPLIVVSGLPRSGTSMVMQMLEVGGLEIVTDDVRKADDDNPRGYYELERVKELDKGGDKSWLQGYKGKAVKVISYLLKDLPLYLNYRVVFILRNIDEVLASQRKMLIHRREDHDAAGEAKMKANFENHLRRVRYFLKNTPNFEAVYINHRDILNSPEEQVKRMNKFVGNNLDEQAMANTVDPGLYRNRA